MEGVPGLCWFFGMWCLHIWVWWVEVWCWLAVGWSWDFWWVVVTVSSLCRVQLLSCPPCHAKQQITACRKYSASETNQNIMNTVLKCPPASHSISNLSPVNIHQWWQNTSSFFIWGYKIGGRRSSSIAAAYVKILRQMRSGQGEEEHTMKVTNQRRTWCLKSEGRTGKHATVCQIKGDQRCWVVMVVVGCSVLCLLVVLGLSCSLPALDWSLLVLVVLVDRAGVLVLAGHIFCK